MSWARDHGATTLLVAGLLLAVGYDMLGRRRLDAEIAQLSAELKAVEEAQAAGAPSLRLVPPRRAPPLPSSPSRSAPAPEAGVDPPPPAGAPDPKDPSAGPRGPWKPGQMTVSDIHDWYAAYFAWQAVDAAWARVATKDLRRVIDAGLPAGSTFVSLECKSTYCRIVVEHEESNVTMAHNELADAFFTAANDFATETAGGSHSACPDHGIDGRMRCALYIIRTGFPTIPAPLMRLIHGEQ